MYKTRGGIMENAIEITDLNFSYNDKVIFEQFSVNIKKSSFTTLIGNNGSGKSTLVKIILGLIKTDSRILINGIQLNDNNLNTIRQQIGVVFENPDNSFVAETVMDDIAFVLENQGLGKEEIDIRVQEISSYLKIKHLLNYNPHQLSGGEKQLVALAGAIIHKPALLILDESLTMIDTKDKDKILRILNDLNKKQNMTIIHITHEIEDSLYGKDIVLIHDKQLVLHGPKELVLKETKIFEHLEIDLPFTVALSNKLKYYNLTKDISLNMKDLVNDIWK